MHVRRVEQDEPYVQVTADDLGVCDGTNRAIVHGMQHNYVQRASLLVTGGTSASDAAQIFAERGWLDRLGLHLNLTEGTCASSTPPATLCQAGSSAFCGKAEFLRRATRNAICPIEVHQETRAQLHRFGALTGALPAHVDGHHHCHVASVEIAVAIANALPPEVRRVRQPHDVTGNASEMCTCCARAHAVAVRVWKAAYAPVGCFSADAFGGLALCGRRYGSQDIAHIVRTARHRGAHNVEVMAHPGEYAPTTSWYSHRDRQAECAALQDYASASARCVDIAQPSA